MSLKKTGVRSVVRGKGGRRRKVLPDPGQVDFDLDGLLVAIGRSEDAAAMVQAMISVGSQKSQWRGMMAVPPGGLADMILSEFRTKTNIPLEIPFFTLLSIISGFMLKQGITLKTAGLGEITPDIWTVVLAASGAGKTFTQKQIGSGINIGDVEFPGTGIVSSAAFVAALEAVPKGLWIRDEFAQFLKSIDQSEGPLADMKDYMLRLYDNGRIERTTKKESISVPDPALTILGMTVLETFGQYVSAESMLDGFAQRFAYVIAEPDAERHWRDFPLWVVDNKRWGAEWSKITRGLHHHYIVDDTIIMPAFSTAFQALFNEHVPESFYRRLMWRSAKYALIYHVLRGDTDQNLKGEDFGWAARVISLHVQDAARLIGEHNLSGLEKVLQSAERVIAKVRDKEGRKATARDLVRGVSAIKTAGMAQQILSMLAR